MNLAVDGVDHSLRRSIGGSYSLNESGDPFRPFYGPGAQRWASVTLYRTAS
jgi:hypothetical protein